MMKQQQQNQRRSLLTQVFLKVFGVILRFTLEALNMFGPCDKLINMNKRMSVSVSVSASENRENGMYEVRRKSPQLHSWSQKKKRKEKKGYGTEIL